MERQSTSNSLRILIDGTSARGGGGFTYLVNILPQLARLAPQQRFRVLLRNPFLANALPSLPNLEVDLLNSEPGLAERLRFVQMEIPRMAQQWGADLYFSTAESVPFLTPCSRIAAFRNPNVYTKLDQGWPLRQRMRLSVLRSLSRFSAWSCQRILFVSQDSAEWIGNTLRIPQHKRCAIQHGIDADSWRSAEQRPLHTLPYILSVSSIYRYKNFLRLIEAYTELASRNHDCPDLLIIGDDQDPAYSEKMRAAKEESGEFAENIHVLGNVPYEDIQSYYAAAEIFVFPSYLETFGHPLLEAMASGLPTVAADIPVFREVAGDAVLYFDPHNASDLAEAMEEALFKPGVAKTLTKRGAERVKHFSWERSANGLLRLFQEVWEEDQAKRP